MVGRLWHFGTILSGLASKRMRRVVSEMVEVLHTWLNYVVTASGEVARAESLGRVWCWGRARGNLEPHLFLVHTTASPPKGMGNLR